MFKIYLYVIGFIPFLSFDFKEFKPVFLTSKTHVYKYNTFMSYVRKS